MNHSKMGICGDLKRKIMKHHQKDYHSLHEGTVLTDKFTTEDIFARILQVADEEVKKGTRELLFSSLAAGLAITLTFIMYVSLTAKSGGNPFLSALLYPLGFVFIVLGGYQLFTENTLPPVALVIERVASLPRLLRVWSIVLLGNILGGLFGAFITAKTGIFTPEIGEAATKIGLKIFETSFSTLFFRGMIAGLIVAGVVWLDYAMRDGVVRFFIVYFSFLAIPLANLNHVVITVTEMFYLYFSQGVNILEALGLHALPVLLGNIAGGVLLVTVVNWFQTKGYIKKSNGRLNLKDWLFSNKVLE